MPFLSDITHRLLAGRNLSQINSGISRQRTYGNPYGIGGPADSNPDLPPEAYPHGIPPPGYQTSTAYAGGPAYGPTDTSLYPPSDSSLPPAASGVTPGPAYQGYPDLSGEPTVIVNQPPGVGSGIPVPGPYVPPDWVYPGQSQNVPASQYPGLGGSPSGDWTQNAASSAQVYPQYGVSPGYINPQDANMSAFGLADWNAGGWNPNIADTEASQGGDRYGMGGALAARFGLMGVQGGGVDFRKHIK